MFLPILAKTEKTCDHNINPRNAQRPVLKLLPNSELARCELDRVDSEKI
jgi:hypothetical protein